MSKYLVTIFLLIVALQNLEILRSTYRISIFSAVDITFTYGVAFLITAIPYEKVRNTNFNFLLLVVIGTVVHVMTNQETSLVKVIIIALEISWLVIKYILCYITLFFGITSICEQFVIDTLLS